jgi:polysaccharide export outer membrane protein
LLYLKFPAALCCALLLAACASRGGPVQGQVDVLPPGDPVAEAAGRAEYRIGPSDLLEIKVFQVEDLEREVRVDNAGNIVLPLIGNVVAAGKTVPELQAEIARAYGENYLQHPQVSVLVKESGSLRVTVSGEVEKPGIYPIESEMTLVQALASAEGFSEIGDLHNVLVFRTVDGQRMFARYDIEAIQEGTLADPVLTGNDIVVVPPSTRRSAWLNFIKLSPLFAVWLRYQ